MSLNLGDFLGQYYKIVRKLGQGGFASTYLAQNTALPGDPLWVVKEITPKPNDPSVLQKAKERFEQEAQALYRLGQHPQIPQLAQRFQENEKFYLVQEFIEGQPLNDILTPDNKLSEREVVELLRDILEVVKVVHEYKVIHRDITPSNLIRRKQDGKIVLIDFGAVKEISTLAVTSSGQISVTEAIGTAGYMPAEQFNCHPRFNSDIYAVGMIGYPFREQVWWNI